MGRIAGKAAVFLMGKHSPKFKKNTIPETKVKVIHVSKIDFDVKKMEKEYHIRYSGYPGGLKKKNLRQVVAQKGYSEVMREAVYGMLPPNKQRRVMMKNLTISE